MPTKCPANITHGPAPPPGRSPTACPRPTAALWRGTHTRRHAQTRPPAPHLSVTARKHSNSTATVFCDLAQEAFLEPGREHTLGQDLQE